MRISSEFATLKFSSHEGQISAQPKLNQTRIFKHLFVLFNNKKNIKNIFYFSLFLSNYRVILEQESEM